MLKKLLIANRGEIAIRIAQAAAELGIATVGIHSEDDATSLHVRRVDEAGALSGRGAAAYLDIAGVIAAARAAGCDAIHPGYGFLSENAAFARACAEAGLVFVGPTPEQLELFGDKARARAHARQEQGAGAAGHRRRDRRRGREGVLRQASARRASCIKAIAGGGGRGMRIVTAEGEIADAFARASAEAKAAFGNGDLYAERLIAPGAPHRGADRRRRHGRHRGPRRARMHAAAPQPEDRRAGAQPQPRRRLRRKIVDAAVAMAKAVNYRSLGTFEFLVDDAATDFFCFIEANPRLQVEHTVTEEVWGVDLVKAQLRLAGGASLAEAGVDEACAARPCHPAAHQHGDDDGRTARPSRAAARSPSSSRRRGRACASTPTAMPATAPIPTSTRCWPR